MSKTITAQINNEQITIYFGATLKNALLQVDEKLYRQVVNEEAEIHDQFGNNVQIDGAVDDGFSYYIVKK